MTVFSVFQRDGERMKKKLIEKKLTVVIMKEEGVGGEEVRHVLSQ